MNDWEEEPCTITLYYFECWGGDGCSSDDKTATALKRTLGRGQSQQSRLELRLCPTERSGGWSVDETEIVAAACLHNPFLREGVAKYFGTFAV
jgi:hypothetical protein